jgi:hypothetical protein
MGAFLIFVITKGGLGNQLFQYTFAHELASLSNTKVTLISCWHERHPDRDFMLTPILKFCSHNIQARSWKIIYSYSENLSKFNVKTNYRLKKFLNFIGYFEQSSPYEPILKTTRRFAIFSGYFQDLSSLAKIDEVLDEICSELASSHPDAQTNPYQAIHVRRGDYAQLKSSYGVLTPEYFKQNLDLSLHLYILSDDKSLSESELFIESTIPHFYPNLDSLWKEFAILAKAKHLVMSNSTFSWWAGRICAKMGGLAIAPNPWFVDPNIQERFMLGDTFKKADAYFENFNEGSDSS